jgi:tetratricopeptide (TPR) repeat protein
MSERRGAGPKGATSFLLSASFVLVFFIAAKAQTVPAEKSSAGDANVTRAAPSSSEAAKDEGDETAAVEKPRAASAPARGGDRLETLRAQIAEAKTSAERWRLQRTLVEYLAALGKKHEAVDELRAMARTEKLDPVYFYNTGNALARLGATDDAVEAYRKAIEQRHGNYARALNNLGVLLLRQGEWDKAQEALANALKLENSRYGEASFNLGRVHAARGEADQAIKEWSRTLVVAPDHADAAAALARAYAEDGSPERGLTVLENFTKRNGASEELAQVRREILAAGSAGEAEESSAEADTTRPASAGREAGETPRPKAAAAKAGAGLRTLSVDQETYDLLQSARAAREGGKNEEAVKLYRRVLMRSGGFFPPANLEMAYTLSALRRYDEAVASLAQVAEREGGRYPIAFYHLGRQYEQLGQFDLAAKAYERAAAAYGETNTQFLLDLSRARDKAGDAEAALAAMETFVRIARSQGRLPEWSQSRLAELREKAGQKQ